MHEKMPFGEKYTLVCPRCGRRLPSDASRCPNCPDALLRSAYADKTFRPLARPDLFRFLPWLPLNRPVDTPIGPTVYRSERLAHRLGLRELWIGFNGYAPEVGARNVTGTFKDYEALPTLLHFRERGLEAAVLASVGNSARAFAHAAICIGYPIIIVAPESALGRLWLPVPPTDVVRLVVLEGSRDYAAAIRVAQALAMGVELPSEGGARNIARRDGMGTVLLEHVRTTGRLPRHYIQAISSGTGGIATWEAALRLIDDGRYGTCPPQLHLVQNEPFAPIHDAWTLGRPIRPEEDVAGQLRAIETLSADVLANRNPPYAVGGGVRDALQATRGHTYAVSNQEIATGQHLFESHEGIPIGPESGAALAALRQGVEAGSIGRTDSILLNITGNGDALLRRDFQLHPLEPWHTIPAGEASGDLLRRWIERISSVTTKR